MADEDSDEERGERAWNIQTKTLEQVNQALELQARRLNDLAQLLDSHAKAWQETLAEAQDLMKNLKDSQQREDQARSELVAVTAAMVKIAQVAQQQIEALQAETAEE